LRSSVVRRHRPVTYHANKSEGICIWPCIALKQNTKSAIYLRIYSGNKWSFIKLSLYSMLLLLVNLYEKVGWHKRRWMQFAESWTVTYFINTSNSSNLSHGRFFRHFWGTASPTFETLRTTKCYFLVL
jgi:hypothetical protein